MFVCSSDKRLDVLQFGHVLVRHGKVRKVMPTRGLLFEWQMIIVFVHGRLRANQKQHGTGTKSLGASVRARHTAYFCKLAEVWGRKLSARRG